MFSHRGFGPNQLVFQAAERQGFSFSIYWAQRLARETAMQPEFCLCARRTEGISRGLPLCA